MPQMPMERILTLASSGFRVPERVVSESCRDWAFVRVSVFIFPMIARRSWLWNVLVANWISVWRFLFRYHMEILDITIGLMNVVGTGGLLYAFEDSARLARGL